MERQAQPATAPDPDPGEIDARRGELRVEEVAAEPLPLAAEDDAEPAGNGLWVVLVLGIAVLLALCVVLVLVAYDRAPPGAPG